MLAHVLLELVGLALQTHHFLLHLFHTFPVFGHHGLEEGHQMGRTFVGLGDVLLHRPDGGPTEQAGKGIDWH
ncbi:hypothetical protein D3C77_453200 [compost metagenome]